MLLKAIAYIKAIGELKHYRFLIIGDGELKEVLMQNVKEMNITDFVVFTGWRKDMASIYPALDAVVLTSKNEGTPVALIEAMAAKKPVIATSVGGVPDLLGRVMEMNASGFNVAKNGILIPNNNHKALVLCPIVFIQRSQCDFNDCCSST